MNKAKEKFIYGTATVQQGFTNVVKYIFKKSKIDLYFFLPLTGDFRLLYSSRYKNFKLANNFKYLPTKEFERYKTLGGHNE